jgi:hypothetical protein
MQGELNTTIAAMNSASADIDADVLLAQDWATKDDAAVTGTDWSAFANASGNAPTGSAKDWASEDEDTPVITGEFSAKHYSIKSAASAAASLTSENNAATSETNAANSASAAATSEANAANTYDQFDDRYLGAFATDPTTDNDGDPLVTGAQYFNTTSDATKVYNGSAWQDSAPIATSVTVSQISDFPSQTGEGGKFLTTDGSVLSFGEVAGGISYVVKTADYTAASGEFILVDTTSGIVTITLPSSPAAGDTVTVTDSNSNTTQNAVIVARNGNNIMGISEDLYISQSGSTASLVYSGTDWRLF